MSAVRSAIYLLRKATSTRRKARRDQEAQYTAWSTGIKEVQADRDLSNSLGETKTDVAGGKSESTFNHVSRRDDPHRAAPKLA
jgi:hypothetical protein